MSTLNKKNTLNSLTEYQDGAVVSKTIIMKDKGTVTLFAFTKGEGLSEHTLPFDALVLVTEGTATITISSNEHDISEGEMIIMPANEPHAIKAVTSFKMMLVMIRE